MTEKQKNRGNEIACKLLREKYRSSLSESELIKKYFDEWCAFMEGFKYGLKDQIR